MRRMSLAVCLTSNAVLPVSYKEIAEILGVSPKTVDYRIQQALKQLRVDLKDYLPLLLPILFP